MRQNNKLVAITGGIGSGKSSALEILRDLGYPVFSCDEEVSRLYKKRGILKALKKEFPSAVKGRFLLSADKKEIAKICFTDDSKRLFLETVLSRPALNNALKKAKKINGIAFVEVPLLYECNAQTLFYKTIVIKRGLEKRIESVKSRSALSEEEITARIKKQIDYDSFDFKDAIVIENNSDIAALKSELETAIKEI